MAITVAQCPQCHHANIILAPIPATWKYTPETPCGDLPVACTECSWKGLWRDLVYMSL
jgi:hypothetical protein